MTGVTRLTLDPYVPGSTPLIVTHEFDDDCVVFALGDEPIDGESEVTVDNAYVLAKWLAHTLDADIESEPTDANVLNIDRTVTDPGPTFVHDDGSLMVTIDLSTMSTDCIEALIAHAVAYLHTTNETNVRRIRPDYDGPG